MTLESLLKPVKWVDEQVERQYAKARKEIDERGFNVYMITFPMNIFFATIPPIIGVIVESAYAGVDGGRNLLGLLHNTNNQVTDGTVAVNKYDHIIDRILNTPRLPILLTGTSLTMMGVYQLADTYLFSGEVSSGEVSSGEGIQNLLTGLGWISQASSVYLKYADPKLLDKAPVWKKAYTWARDKLSSIAPQPTPQPLPG